MSFHHRKLLNDSLEDSIISKRCVQYCDLTQNQDGLCPLPCIYRCYPICNRELSYDLPPPPPPYVADHSGRSYRLSVFLTVSLAVLATAFVVFFCYTAYKFYKGRYRSRRRQPPAPPQEAEARLDFLDEDHGPVIDHPIWYIRTIGLQPSVISAITICKYKRGDGLVEGTECSVCLNEFQEDETLRLLPKCNHAFHIPCIDTWLRSHTNCPMCRAGIVTNSASPHSPGQSSSYRSGSVEEPQLQVSENNRESWGDSEDEELQRVTIQVEAEEGSLGQNSFKRDLEDLGWNSNRQGDGIQPIRRSVSMDSLSASMVSAAITNAFPVHSSDRNPEKQVLHMNETSSCVALKRVDAGQNSLKSTGSSSSERPLQKGSSSSSTVMRSLSCSAKVFLSRYSRNSRSSVPLPRSF